MSNTFTFPTSYTEAPSIRSPLTWRQSSDSENLEQFVEAAEYYDFHIVQEAINKRRFRKVGITGTSSYNTSLDVVPPEATQYRYLAKVRDTLASFFEYPGAGLSDEIISDKSEFGVLLSRINALMTREEDEDEEDIPSDYAYNLVSDLLTEAYSLIKTVFPRGSASESSGGIRVTWVNKNKEVRLVVPAQPNRNSYIYQESSDQYSLIEKASAIDLSYWLKWLGT